MVAKTLESIKADAKTIRQMLDKTKYEVDVFQREYAWQRKHIEQLVTDLTSKFSISYSNEHKRKDVQNYPSYFLGSTIINVKDNKKTIIDGQQRLTSLTLLLIYLNNLQAGRADSVQVKDLIFSERYAEKSFNLLIPDRADCIEALFSNDPNADTPGSGSESVKNLIERYHDIEELFPEELKKEALPYFIDWLVDNVTLVEIKTYADEDAYTIFETMNDRGLNLTPTEMLKGYLLSRVETEEYKLQLNDVWRTRIFEIKEEIDEVEDLEFFKAWLRAKYAQTIRQTKAGSENEDFEKIATRFHSWVKDNANSIGLKDGKSYRDFIDRNFQFYSKLYLKIDGHSKHFDMKQEYIYYLEHMNFPRSFYFPLLMAPIQMADTDQVQEKKIVLVSRFLETFLVLRGINYRTLAYSSIRYTMFSLIKDIRDKTVEELNTILKDKVKGFSEKFENFDKLRLHGMNKRFVHFLLARITRHIEEETGISSNFADYVSHSLKRPFQIEHIWSDKFQLHNDEFSDKSGFEEFRNKVGGLLLIQQGPNQSYNDDVYEEKLPSYFGQNLLAKSLNPSCYEKNPGFMKYIKRSSLPFVYHAHFKKSDLDQRQLLYKRICEEIWNVDKFDLITCS